ncbi:tRNA 2-thiouridine(34) synthase MnmA [Chloroflexota bacterium]
MASVLVAMSGGVDSSVAAALLKEKGYRVSGVIMRIWGGGIAPGKVKCTACYGPGEEDDIEDARRVCQVLDIPFYTIDLIKEYKSEVLDYYYSEYLSGRTPNPCFQCNHRVKFGALVDEARESGIEFDCFATGHYARVEYSKDRKRYLLKKAQDTDKDQSYFLSSLSQEQLERSLFPIGEYTKEEVRKLARDLELGVEHKPESQDFIAGSYQPLAEAAQPGPVLDRQGNILGEHRGIPFYTVGQRKGLGISSKEPIYVTSIDPDKNAIIVGRRDEVYRDELTASGLNWIAIEKPESIIRVKAKVRYLHQEVDATVKPINEDSVYVKFDSPQFAITPGQAVVFYQGEVVVGGGIIERAGG